MSEKFQQAWDASTTMLVELSKKIDGLSLLSVKLSEMEKRQMEHDKLMQYLQTKMDLSMKSLAQVSQDQSRLANTVSNAVGGMREPGKTSMGDGLIGPPPGPPPPPKNGQPQGGQTQVPRGPVFSIPVFGDFISGSEGREGLENDYQGRKGWLPKLEFPYFEGDDVRVWLDNCESYFELYQIPVGFCVCAASMHLRGRAAHWFQASRDTLHLLNWNQFKEAVLGEFEANTHSDRMLELLTLKQTGTVLEYKTHFEKLVYHIKLYDKATSEIFLVTQFMLGLKQEIKMGVEVMFPQTVSMAAQLALKHEGWQTRQNSGGRKFQAARTNIPMGTKELGETTGELWKAKQLKEYRRVNGLCYKCGEKYMPGHKCKIAVAPQLNCIVLNKGGDGGPMLSDEVLNFLETGSGSTEEEMMLSVHAMSGTENSKCVRLRALIKDQVMLQLLDSGGSNTFISELAFVRVQCVTKEIDPVNVKVANGQIITYNRKVVQLEWWCCGHTFVADAFVLPETAYDMVIGMDWLEKFSPMLCAWDSKWVEFSYEGVTVRLQGLVPRDLQELQETSCEQLSK